ncbi:MAG: DUF2330 domain-containing protein [Kofleriaceae bacterium]
MIAASLLAFCGFYVAGSDQPMFNDATQVVLMRKGTRTVLSMQNNYKGPLQDFAMVIPVPVVLHDGDVKTLPKQIFDDVERMSAPRLVEYWEQDPCRNFREDAIAEARNAGILGTGMALDEGKMGKYDVKVEAQFAVGEYNIEILSAKDSTGLDAWLHDNHYMIPAGAEPLLRPYVEGGSKWFVAKVDPKKVQFVDGRAALSPLRFHYDSERFDLPIRLGLANSQGTQDLIVNILAPNQRYDVANYKNVTIPTNLDVKDDVKAKFGGFYAALFDRTLEKNPGAVVTEYSWQATSCDPCPGPQLTPSELMSLGEDVLPSSLDETTRYYGGSDMVLTRLHARYGKDIKDDLVFKAAPPIVGGREYTVPEDRTHYQMNSRPQIEQGARPDSENNFQARYVIRHEWKGPISCIAPVRGVWGGPPEGETSQPQAATNLAFTPKVSIALPDEVEHDIPEIGVKSKAGCGCQASDPTGLLAGLALGSLAFFRPRGRRVRR